MAKLVENQDTDGNIFASEDSHTVHKDLLHDLVALDPFVTKSSLCSSLKMYNDSIGIQRDELWYRRQAWDLRQILSTIRRKAERVKTGQRQPPSMRDLVNSFKRRRQLKKRSSEPTSLPGPVHKTAPSSGSPPPPSETPTSSTLPANKKQVFALYGVQLPSPTQSPQVVDLCSSDDDVECCTQPAAPQQTPKPPEAVGGPFFDAHLNCVVRATRDGQLEEAYSTTPGADGFLVGHFADGTVFETDVPNLAHLPLKQERTKTKAKAKSKAQTMAKAMAKAKAKAQPLTNPASPSQPKPKKGNQEQDQPLQMENYRRVNAKDKAYILWRSAEGKWVHLVSVYYSQTTAFEGVITKIWEALPMSKEQAVELRARLLEAHT